MSELISIIVPVFNAEKYLNKCIQSILGQTYSNIELLLIDDGSTDSSGAICDNYGSQDSRVRVFHKLNEGVSVARNWGLDNAKGEWITFVDSDDWIDADMYEQMYNAAMQKKADMVSCDLLMEHKDYSRILSCNNKYDDHKLMYDCLVPISVEYFAMWNKLVSREVYDRGRIKASIGLNMWEDVELMTKIRYFSKSSCVINKPYYHYNKTNENSITNSLKLINQVEGQIQRVKQIELFFSQQGELPKYKHFVSLLKFQAKKALFDNYTQKWVDTFPEAKWSLIKLRKHLSKRELIKYSLLSFGGRIGFKLYENCFTKNRKYFSC